MSKSAACDQSLFLNNLEIFKDIKNKREIWLYKKKKNNYAKAIWIYIYLKILRAVSDCDIRVKILLFCVLKKRYLFIRT